MSPPASYIIPNEKEGSMCEWIDCNKHHHQVCMIQNSISMEQSDVGKGANNMISVVNNGYWLVSSMLLYNIKVKMTVTCVYMSNRHRTKLNWTVFVYFVSDNSRACSKSLIFAYPWSATTPLERPILSCIWEGRTSEVLLYIGKYCGRILSITLNAGSCSSKFDCILMKMCLADEIPWFGEMRRVITSQWPFRCFKSSSSAHIEGEI